MTKAHALFTAVPKLHNCAQAVADGCGAPADILDAMKVCGGGKAPDGLCGALHAAVTLFPDRAEEIKSKFAETVGGIRCREIKTGPKTPCPVCVETAARLAGCSEA